MVIFIAVSTEWLERIRREGESLEQELSAAHLANLRGLASEIPLTQLYEKYSNLASQATFERLGELLEDAGGDADGSDDATTARRSIAMLLEYVGTNIERRAAADAVERRLAIEAELEFDVEGREREVPFRALQAEIQSCQNRNRRDALERALAAGRRRVSDLSEEAHRRARDAAGEAGGDDYISWRSHLGRFDIDALGRDAETLLAATDDMARDALDWLVRNVADAPSRQHLKFHDLLFAMGAADLDELLPRDELWRVDDFFGRLGFDLEAGGRIVRDTDARPHKSGRAYCVPLRVPDEVYLVLPPSSGLPRWRALLHELGHAVHIANIAPDRPFEHRYLGDSSLSEGFAVLFDHLLLNPVWARKVLKLSPSKADRVTRTAAAVALMITRRNTAKLLHEIAYHRGAPDAAELFFEHLRRASGVAPLTDGYQHEVDPELYCGRYVRAWMFEGLAHFELRERFDEDWFLNPSTSATFLRLFSEGYARDLHEVAQQELGSSLEPEVIARRFEEVL